MMVARVGSGHPIGAALEVLLRAARFEPGSSGRPTPSGQASRGPVFGSAYSPATESSHGLPAAGMSVLELVRDGVEDERLRENRVPGPSHVEVLGEGIRAALQHAARDRD